MIHLYIYKIFIILIQLLHTMCILKFYLYCLQNDLKYTNSFVLLFQFNFTIHIHI